MSYYVIYKPYGVVSQFSPTKAGRDLSSLYNFPSAVYPVGRLDKDSEGLLIITEDKFIHSQLLDPKNLHPRTYLVQVEGEVSAKALDNIRSGPVIRINKKGYRCKPCKIKLLKDPPDLHERVPPIRFRKDIPTSWLSITLIEGKNRQIRRMTATEGVFTLRLIRISIVNLDIKDFEIGEVREYSKERLYNSLKV